MQKSVPTNEMSEFKGVGLTGVGLPRVDCSVLALLQYLTYIVKSVHTRTDILIR